ENVGILLVENNRAKAYLQMLASSGLLPSHAILISSSRLGALMPDRVYAFFANLYSHAFKNWRLKQAQAFNANEPLVCTLAKNRIPYVRVAASNCNDKKVIELLKKLEGEYAIYCGGGILKEEVLSLGKKFIHVHPGRLPQYKGSTCFYYSIIKEGKCSATAFFMTPAIDAGDIILQKDFPMPKNIDIDNVYDPLIRAHTLVETMKKYSKTKKLEARKQHGNGETYFVIHPVLKHIAVLKARSSKESKEF
ncbi:MAG: formyltransferase family protein, partial [Candidatus Diapherotrites archaeon]|nr:formyltransferase family protein [Candidatus Diapherotrites archaeon]